MPETPEHSHAPDAIRARLAGWRGGGGHIRDFVYGGIDGAITTLAVVAGVKGADLSETVVLILGLANLLADGFSMAASNYSGAKTVVDDLVRTRAVERRHIRDAPEGEREEVRQILAAKGLTGATLDAAMRAVTADDRAWVELMVTDEYGMSPDPPSPLIAGAITFMAFLICGAVPLIPFVVGAGAPFALSVAMTCVTFLAIGAAKSRWSLSHWWASALETLVIGGAASAIASGAGLGTQAVVG